MERLTCPFIVPDATTNLGDVLRRWTQSHLSAPAIIITPNTEDDIVVASHLAKENGLNIVPGGGGHGTFTTIDNKTAYLDLKNFNDIQLGQASSTVRLQAGVRTGNLLKYLVAQGYYTAIPNSNTVGAVGTVLGGGNTSQNGLHGFMVDNALSFHIITAEGKAIEVESSSTGEDLALFYALCGAGHGLGVVMAATMEAYPISSLRLTENKVWTGVPRFPPAALNDVVEAFSSFDPPAVPLNVQITFLYSPSGAPAAGSPIIVLSATYYGPSEDAEKAAAKLFEVILAGKALKAYNAPVSFSNINDGFEPPNAHGGFKCMNAARIKSLTPQAIKESFANGLKSRNSFPTRLAHKLRPNGNMKDIENRFLEGLDRGSTAMALTWCVAPASRDRQVDFVDEFFNTCRCAGGVPPKTFANRMRLGVNLDELFQEEKAEELQRVKEHWDPHGAF
ncbi:6-hydroxy-D-nicotine oxidase [Fusarium sp. Ph1]|nr:6-hydroxy-D-nicotine oxidase [Fusarium sp. Ph1]